MFIHLFFNHRYMRVDTTLAAAVHWSDVSARPPFWQGQAVPHNACVCLLKQDFSSIKTIITHIACTVCLEVFCPNSNPHNSLNSQHIFNWQTCTA